MMFMKNYNPAKKKVLIVFDMIADVESNEKLTPIVTELFLRWKKLNITVVLYHNLISKCLKL